ncbi:20054_t:CDS:2, partial [Racocetra fulgida]
SKNNVLPKNEKNKVEQIILNSQVEHFEVEQTNSSQKVEHSANSRVEQNFPVEPLTGVEHKEPEIQVEQFAMERPRETRRVEQIVEQNKQVETETKLVTPEVSPTKLVNSESSVKLAENVPLKVVDQIDTGKFLKELGFKVKEKG